MYIKCMWAQQKLLVAQIYLQPKNIFNFALIFARFVGEINVINHRILSLAIHTTEST